MIESLEGKSLSLNHKRWRHPSSKRKSSYYDREQERRGIRIIGWEYLIGQGIWKGYWTTSGKFERFIDLEIKNVNRKFENQGGF